MQTIVVESAQITLPLDILKKFQGKEIRFVELQDIVIMEPVSDAITEARGFLKNRRFSTERYFQMKLEAKELEK